MSINSDEHFFAKQMTGKIDPSSPESKLECLVYRSGKGCACISLEGIKFLAKARDQILENKAEYFSIDPKKLRKDLSDILCDLVYEQKKDPVPDLDKKIRDLLKIKKYVSYIPIFNLDHGDPIQMDFCTLYPQNYSIPSLQGKGDPSPLESLQKNTRFSDYKYVISEITVKACTHEAAAEIAYNKIGEIVRYFWFFGGVQVFTSADKSSASKELVMINKKDDTIYNISENISESHFYNPLSMNVFDNNKRVQGFFKWLSNPTPINFQPKICETVIWAGDAMNDRENHHALLKMVIALESLLLDSDDSNLNKRETVAERTAFVLEKDRENRIKIKNDVSDFCCLRNDIVHAGNRKRIQRTQILKIHQIISGIVEAILFTHSFSDLKELKDYVENEKFS